MLSKKQSLKNKSQLKFGWSLLVLGICLLAFSSLAFSAYFYDKDVWKKLSEFISISLLFTVFGSAAIYYLVEYFKVYGRYDNTEILFSTPWSGVKHEKWDDLLTITYNGSASWYVLVFKSGNVIRLSTLLKGSFDVLNIIESKGFNFVK